MADSISHQAYISQPSAIFSYPTISRISVHQPSAIFSYPAIIPISHRRFFRARPSAAPAIGRWPGGQTSGHRSSADGRGGKPSVHQTSADYVQSTITDGRYHQSASLRESQSRESTPMGIRISPLLVSMLDVLAFTLTEYAYACRVSVR